MSSYPQAGERTTPRRPTSASEQQETTMSNKREATFHGLTPLEVHADEQAAGNERGGFPYVAEGAQAEVWAQRRYPDTAGDTPKQLNRNAGRREGYVAGYAAGTGALREAVLSLHVSTSSFRTVLPPNQCATCSSDDYDEPYPCPTVRAITDALGGA